MLIIDLHGVTETKVREYLSNALKSFDFSSSDHHLEIITINIDKEIVDSVIDFLKNRNRIYKIFAKKIIVYKN